MYKITLNLHRYQLKKLMELVSQAANMPVGVYKAPDSCIVPHPEMEHIIVYDNGKRQVMTPAEYFEERIEKIMEKDEKQK